MEYKDLWTRVRTDWRLSPQVRLRNDTCSLDAEREWRNLEEYSYDLAANHIDRAFYLGIIHDQQQAGRRGDLLIETELCSMGNRFSVGGKPMSST